MIIVINFADDKYKKTQKFNSRSAKKHGADKVIQYSPQSISDSYKEKNKEIFQYKRGAGYWIWKPYIINEALKAANDGDYIIYIDAAAAFVNKINYLIDAMETSDSDIMVFAITLPEYKYTKRDVFILMDCDKEEYFNSLQRCGTYLIVKKTLNTQKFIEEYLNYVQDSRIVTDDDNVMGKENYNGFVENRHDQSVLSLLSKKWNIKPFRDPSQYGNHTEFFPKDILQRSNYPQVIDLHRNSGIINYLQLNNREKQWYKIIIWIINKCRIVIKKINSLCNIQ